MCSIDNTALCTLSVVHSKDLVTMMSVLHKALFSLLYLVQVIMKPTSASFPCDPM